MLNIVRRRQLRQEAMNLYQGAIESGMGEEEAEVLVLEKMQGKYAATDRAGIADWLAIIELIMQLLDLLKPKQARGSADDEQEEAESGNSEEE